MVSPSSLVSGSTTLFLSMLATSMNKYLIISKGDNPLIPPPSELASMQNRLPMLFDTYRATKRLVLPSYPEQIDLGWTAAVNFLLPP